RRSSVASCVAISVPNKFQKFLYGTRSRRFCKSESGKLSAVIVRAADEDFFPRLRVRRRKVVTVCEFVDLLWRQLSKKSLGQVAQKRVAQAVDALEMFEEKDQLFEMFCLQFAVNAVKRMSDRMRDVRRLQVALEVDCV